MLKLPAHSACRARHGEGLFDLAQNLRLAHHHRIQAGGHAEQMPHRLLIAMLVEVRSQQRRVQAKVPLQKTSQAGSIRLHRGQNLDPITSGDDHAFGHSGHGGQGARGLRQIVARDGDPLAHLNGRGLVVDADEDQAHCGPNLCTRLKTLAASTASITRKTAPER